MTDEATNKYHGCPDPREYVRREQLVLLINLMPVINVKFVDAIPTDWPGLMGVPISYMDKHDPDRFEIIDHIKPRIDGKDTYERIVIRNKKPTLPEWCRLSDYGLTMFIGRITP